MSASPGSSLWLLRHELRLLWFNAATNKKGSTGRRVSKATIAWFVGLWAMLHGGAYALLRLLAKAEAVPEFILLPVITLLLAALFMLMVSGGLKSSVEVLFDRGDLDLLLSSPLPSQSIFTVRLAGVVIGIASTYLFFLAPLAHVGLALGQYRWLGIYPTIIGMSVIAATAAILLTLALVRMLGARRTRVVAQVIGAIAGALMFLLSQSYNVFSHSSQAPNAESLASLFLPGGPLGPDSMLWLPGRAAVGAPLPLLGMTLLAAGAFFLTVRCTHRFFVHGLQQAASTSRVAAPPRRGVQYRFGRGLPEVIVIKEWRLIARDPHLISQTLLQLLYLLPLCFLIFSDSKMRIPGIATGATMLCSSLAASLTWIIVQAEDAPDLLLASPANAVLVRAAKLAAAVMPPLLVVSVPLLWLLVRQPLAGLMTCFTVTGAVVGTSLVGMWIGRPGSRSGFQQRGQRNLLGIMLELATSLSWAGLAYLLLSSLSSEPSLWQLLAAAALFMLVLLLPLFAWLGRQRGT